MPTIGAPLRKWTAFLLLCMLCSIPTSAAAQATNETSDAVVDTGATASASTAASSASGTPTTAITTTTATTTTTTTSRPSTTTILRSYDSVCPFRTINYITHTLPQQCLRTSWSAPESVASNEEAQAEATPTLYVAGSAGEQENLSGEDKGSVDAGSASPPALPQQQQQQQGQGEGTGVGGTPAASTEHDVETDSPFDNANFLSFDEWKKRNLARAGQSPENVGQGRAASADQKPRRQPVNVNALDSFGEEAEIEIDFSGFGVPTDDPNRAESVGGSTPEPQHGEVTKTTGEEDKVAPSSWALSKDAGKTCKERFNFASFDCAATILKTNKQAKSSSSVLSEHKDSYMLNECSADNKFLIVELCDDILVDTIVLANYEFFSSMFRHFRVSISDRYPVKLDRWRTLATFEARNSRDIQPFLITEPQIWARYLRVEFLTHYGNEFYCPLSLLRVHGTTMMEQFRRDEEEARGVDDDVELIDAAEGGVVEPADNSGPIPVDQVPIPPPKQEDSVPKEPTSVVSVEETTVSSNMKTTSTQAGQSSESPPSAETPTMVVAQSDEPVGTQKTTGSPDSVPMSSSTQTPSSTGNHKEPQPNSVVPDSSPTVEKVPESTSVPAPSESSITTTAAPTSGQEGAATPLSSSVASAATPSSPGKASDNTVASPPVQSSSRSSPTQPSPASPTTQESFFKSIHKRLQYLEANSTLSLQYIEEQSRILRDAFMKVEKKQMAKTEKFLDNLNSTVMQELKSYRNMYDQLWQSTIIELESMKERQNTEIGEIGSRLTLLADELVWQKRMAVIQSTLLLLCLGLVLFARSGTLGASSDVPIVQQLGTKYSSFFDSPPRVDMPQSGIFRRRSTFRSMWRSDTSMGMSERSHPMASDAESDDARSPIQIAFSPPTPRTLHSPCLDSDMEASPRQPLSGSFEHHSPPAPPQLDTDLSPEDQAQRIAVLETQSGPATPHGTRDYQPSWEEVDRAIDQLKEEQGETVEESSHEERGRRAPIRRAHSGGYGEVDERVSESRGSGLLLAA